MASVRAAPEARQRAPLPHGARPASHRPRLPPPASQRGPEEEGQRSQAASGSRAAPGRRGRPPGEGGARGDGEPGGEVDVRGACGARARAGRRPAGPRPFPERRRALGVPGVGGARRAPSDGETGRGRRLGRWGAFRSAFFRRLRSGRFSGEG